MALYDYRRGLVGWAAGMFAGILLMSSFFPWLIGMEGLDELLADYPEALLSLFGMEPGTDFTTAIGYVETEIFSLIVPLTMIGFGVAVGARFVAGEEERGTIGLTLARPVPRWRFVLAKAGALAVLAVALGAVVGVALLLAGPVFRLNLPVENLAAAVAATTALAVLFGWLALGAGAATGRRAVAGGAGWGLAALAYLWNGLTPLVSGLTELTWLSPYEWALGGHPLRTGFDPAGLGWLAAASVVVLALGVVAFTRRDLAA
jgi:ABC-2 type transport system permease protein